MNNQQTGLAFASLGVASLAVAGSCLFFIDSLGAASYLGATLAVFLAMLCATRFSALQRAAVAARPAAAPVATRSWRETSRARLSAREDSEDEVIESRMAALHAAVEDEDAPSTLPPQHFESTSFFAPVESTSGASVEVIEEPLDPVLARQFAEFRPEEAVQDMPSSVGVRQMDDIRAQIARLREESRVRHAANVARGRAPMAAAHAAPAHAMVADAPADADDPFARTEFSSLAGAQPAGFARTQFLVSAER